MSPRIEPLPPEVLGEDLPEPVRRLNIFRTLARHPDLFRAWMPFGGYLLTAGTLSPRDRELLILRTAVNCRSDYEWGQHVRISLQLGIDRETIDRVADGSEDSPLVRAADELHESARISDETWAELAETYDERQLIEIAMLVGQYHMVAFALNSLGVEQDEGLEGLP